MPLEKDAPWKEDALPWVLSSHISMAQLHPMRNSFSFPLTPKSVDKLQNPSPDSTTKKAANN